MIEKFLIRVFNAIPAWIPYALTAVLSVAFAAFIFETSGTSHSEIIIFAGAVGFASSVAALRHFWHRNDEPEEETY